MKFRLIDDAWHRLWSVRVAIGGGLFWSAIGGLIMV